MVTCKAHNLETENACVGSIPTPATTNIISSGLRVTSIKKHDQNDTQFLLSLFFSDLCECSTMASASAFQAEDDSSILFIRSNMVIESSRFPCAKSR